MIYKHTERVDNIRKDKVEKDYNESEMWDTDLTMLLDIWKCADRYEKCDNMFQPKTLVPMP